MKNPYRKGYLAELEVVKALKARDEFHTVLRSAGSRSAIDVVAIGETTIVLCQVKTGKGSVGPVLEGLRSLRVPRYAAVQLWVYRDRRWTIIEVI